MAGSRISFGAHYVRVFARSNAARVSQDGLLVGGTGVKNCSEGGKVAVVRCAQCNDVLTPDDDKICGFCEDYVSFESDPNWNRVSEDEDEDEDECSSSFNFEVNSNSPPKKLVQKSNNFEVNSNNPPKKLVQKSNSC